MGYPSDRFDSFFRNSRKDVKRYLDTAHRDHYKVYNVCAERNYHPSAFDGRVGYYPIEENHAPPLSLIQAFVEDGALWLAEHSMNVIVVHGKSGVERTGLMVACLLLRIEYCINAAEALHLFAARRMITGVALRIPSQIRYVFYYDLLNTFNPNRPPSSSRSLTDSTNTSQLGSSTRSVSPLASSQVIATPNTPSTTTTTTPATTSSSIDPAKPPPPAIDKPFEFDSVVLYNVGGKLLPRGGSDTAGPPNPPQVRRTGSKQSAGRSPPGVEFCLTISHGNSHHVLKKVLHTPPADSAAICDWVEFRMSPEKKVVLCGDVFIECAHRSLNKRWKSGNVLFRGWMHTGFAVQSATATSAASPLWVVAFPKNELDIACNDTKHKLLPPTFRIEVALRPFADELRVDSGDSAAAETRRDFLSRPRAQSVPNLSPPSTFPPPNIEFASVPAIQRKPPMLRSAVGGLGSVPVPIPRRPSDPPLLCHGCGEPVLDDSGCVLNQSGATATFHMECFVCEQCAHNLTGSEYLHSPNGRPMCVRCFHAATTQRLLSGSTAAALYGTLRSSTLPASTHLHSSGFHGNAASPLSRSTASLPRGGRKRPRPSILSASGPVPRASTMPTVGDLSDLDDTCAIDSVSTMTATTQRPGGDPHGDGGDLSTESTVEDILDEEDPFVIERRLPEDDAAAAFRSVDSMSRVRTQPSNGYEAECENEDMPFSERRLECTPQRAYDLAPGKSTLSTTTIPPKPANAAPLPAVAVDPRMSVAAGIGLSTAVAGQETSFVVWTMDAKGEYCDCADTVEAFFVQVPDGEWDADVADNGSPIPARVRATGLGRYEVVYMLRRPGKYRLSVRVMGADIRGSPFEVIIVPLLRPVCAGCAHDMTTGERRVRAMDKLWHPHCFTCARCGTVLRQFGVSKGQPFCARCLIEKAGKCAACGGVFEPGKDRRVKAASAAGGSYHYECFKCSECERSIACAEYGFVGGKLYCKEHFFMLNSCAACLRPLERSYLLALGKKYHRECLVCAVCRQPFKSSFFERMASNGTTVEPVCADCYRPQ